MSPVEPRIIVVYGSEYGVGSMVAAAAGIEVGVSETGNGDVVMPFAEVSSLCCMQEQRNITPNRANIAINRKTEIFPFVNIDFILYSPSSSETSFVGTELKGRA